MVLQSKEKALTILFQCAENYKNNLLNRSLLFVFDKNKKVDAIEARFFNYNFMHLTGVKPTAFRANAATFFQNCINKKYIVKDIKFSDNITTPLKLSVSEISKKWTMPVRDWGLAYSQFSIFFEERLAA